MHSYICRLKKVNCFASDVGCSWKDIRQRKENHQLQCTYYKLKPEMIEMKNQIKYLQYINNELGSKNKNKKKKQKTIELSPLDHRKKLMNSIFEEFELSYVIYLL